MMARRCNTKSCYEKPLGKVQLKDQEKEERRIILNVVWGEILRGWMKLRHVHAGRQY
jgi:hypothetical protein